MMKRVHEIPLEKEYNRILAIKADAEWGNEKPELIPPMTKEEERFWEWADKACKERRAEGKNTCGYIELPYRWFV